MLKIKPPEKNVELISFASKLRITQRCSSKKTEIAINQSKTAIKCPDGPEKTNLPNLGFNKCMHLLKAIKATIIHSA